MIKFTKARCFLVNFKRFYTEKQQEPLVIEERENSNIIAIIFKNINYSSIYYKRFKLFSYQIQ